MNTLFPHLYMTQLALPNEDLSTLKTQVIEANPLNHTVPRHIVAATNEVALQIQKELKMLSDQGGKRAA